MDSADVINHLAQLNSADTYLEIGISAGTTFRQISVVGKIGVDPYPKIDRNLCSVMGIQIMTSDAFFLENKKKFDLIFLDGLHTSDQTAKDFANSVQCSNLTTIWIIDDVYPDSCASSARSLGRYRVMRAFEFLTKRNLRPVGWQGDVFRVIENFDIVNKWFTHWTVCEPGFRMQSIVTWNSQNVNRENFKDVASVARTEIATFCAMIDDKISENKPSILNTQRYLGRDAKNVGQPTSQREVPKWYNAKSFLEIVNQIAKNRLAQLS